MDFPSGSAVNNLPAMQIDPGSIPGWGRFPGEGNDYPIQYSCMENNMNTGAWWVTVYGVTESDRTEQLTHTHTHTHTQMIVSLLPISPLALQNRNVKIFHNYEILPKYVIIPSYFLLCKVCMF